MAAEATQQMDARAREMTALRGELQRLVQLIAELTQRPAQPQPPQRSHAQIPEETKTQAQPQAKPTPAVAPTGLAPADIADPEHAGLLRSVAYCDRRLAEVNKTIMAAANEGVRPDPHLRALAKLCV